MWILIGRNSIKSSCHLVKSVKESLKFFNCWVSWLAWEMSWLIKHLTLFLGAYRILNNWVGSPVLRCEEKLVEFCSLLTGANERYSHWIWLCGHRVGFRVWLHTYKILGWLFNFWVWVVFCCCCFCFLTCEIRMITCIRELFWRHNVCKEDIKYVKLWV